MSVRLDWQVDDLPDELPLAAPPPSAPAPRRTPRMHPRFVLLGAALIVAGLGLIGLWLTQRIQVQTADLTSELTAVVQLEGDAYAKADREVFIGIQDPQDSAWVRRQRIWLGERAAWPRDLPYSYTLRITGLAFENQSAWVELEETRPEHTLFAAWYTAENAATVARPNTYRRVAFYTRRDTGWVHVAPNVDSGYWGETRTRVNGRLTVEYPARDEAVVVAWLNALAPRAEAACRTFACPPSFGWTLYFDPRTTTPQLNAWSTGLTVLDLPPPSVLGYRTDFELDGDVGFALISELILGALYQHTGVPVFYRAGYNPVNVVYPLVAWTAYTKLLGEFDNPPAFHALDLFSRRNTFALDDWLTQYLAGARFERGQYVPPARLGRTFDLINPCMCGGEVDAAAMGMPGFAGHIFQVARIYGFASLAETESLTRYATARGVSLAALTRAALTADSVGAAVLATLDPAPLDVPALEHDWLSTFSPAGRLR